MISFLPQGVDVLLPIDYCEARSRHRSNLFLSYDYCHSLLPLVDNFVGLTDYADFIWSWSFSIVYHISHDI